MIYRHAKRLLDLVFAVVALLLSLPLQAATAGAVAVRLGRPVLFRQVRSGLHGAPFVLVKFRTMLPADPVRGPLDDASRMTGLGRVLRSTSLDELPTLWNIVRGQMSLVGPRPLLMQYLDRYTPQQARRHEVLPGLTGLAQVSGRNGLSWDRKLALDVEYVDQCCMSLDIRILLRTVGVVLCRDGVSGAGEVTMSEFMGEPVPQLPDPRPSLVIVGCGGFGREVYCTVRAINAAGGDWDVEGFVDDDPSPADRDAVGALGARIVGTVDRLAARPHPFHAVVAIGSGAARRAVVDRLAHAPVTYPALIHPDATIGPLVSIDVGVIVATGARLSTNITVGAHVHIDQNATVGHDTVLHDFSRLNPQACVSGSVVVGTGALIGASATVLQGMQVGEFAVVGAGAVVTHPTPTGSTVVGVPARCTGVTQRRAGCLDPTCGTPT